ncbi:hypothetical protein SELMODRAFT_420307 [Selaginella moellendorffii]|uniref:Protein kinase domain-containing protein n=2 Tax=Selaginella moellendorffii TaxID=88036 RepID=D8SBK6_SELML|nr:hypothetical protein SELMODRAFT_420307 [Selaginella moellendorffii]
MARKRRALAVKSSNARAGEEEEDAAAAEDDRVAELCRAIDLQGERLHSGGNLSILVSTVQARATAIRAIRDAQIAEFLAQLQLQQASLSEEMLDMPICDFLERFCPNTELVCKESGVVEMRKKKLPTSDAGDPLASLFALSALKNTSSTAAAAATAKKSSASFFCTPRTLGGGISSSMKTRIIHIGKVLVLLAAAPMEIFLLGAGSCSLKRMTSQLVAIRAFAIRLLRLSGLAIREFHEHHDNGPPSLRGRGLWLVWKFQGYHTLNHYMKQKTFPENLSKQLLGDSATNKRYGSINQRQNALILRIIMTHLLYNLQQIHRTSVVHCDVKPLNLILAGDMDTFKLVDLGACVNLRSVPNETIMDPDYAPPEQYVMPSLKVNKRPAFVEEFTTIAMALIASLTNKMLLVAALMAAVVVDSSRMIQRLVLLSPPTGPNPGGNSKDVDEVAMEFISPPSGPSPGGNGGSRFEVSKPRTPSPPAGPSRVHNGEGQFVVSKPRTTPSPPAGPSPVHNGGGQFVVSKPRITPSPPAGPSRVHNGEGQFVVSKPRTTPSPPAGPSPVHRRPVRRLQAPSPPSGPSPVHDEIDLHLVPAGPNPLHNFGTVFHSVPEGPDPVGN